MKDNSNRISMLLVAVILLFAIPLAQSQTNSIPSNKNLYSIRTGGYCEFFISNDTIYRSWYNTINDNKPDVEKWIIAGHANYRKNLYLVYRPAGYPAESSSYYYIAIKQLNDSCFGIAFTDVLGYGCSGSGCAKKKDLLRTIKNSGFEDRELLFLNFYPASILDSCRRLKDFQNVDTAEAGLLMDCLIISRKNFFISKSTSAIEKNDAYLWSYHRAQSLMMAGFNPLTSSDDTFRTFIKESEKQEFLAKKYAQYTSIKANE